MMEMKVEWIEGQELTLERAAFLCWKMWEWIAETVTQEQWEEAHSNIYIIKKLWPPFKKMPEVAANCFCCEFGVPCDECFLFETWTGGEEDCDSNEDYCLHHPDSPYRKISSTDTSIEKMKLYARSIADNSRVVYSEAVYERERS